MKQAINRRNFLKTSVAGTIGAGVVGSGLQGSVSPEEFRVSQGVSARCAVGAGSISTTSRRRTLNV